MTAFAAACSVYDPGLIDKLPDAGSEDTSASGEGDSGASGGSGGDAGDASEGDPGASGGSGGDAGDASEGDPGGNGGGAGDAADASEGGSAGGSDGGSAGGSDGGSAGDSGDASAGGSDGGSESDGSVVEDAGFDASACQPGDDASCPLICLEVCDGEDNDCDGEVDEGEQWTNKGSSCAVGVGECRASGELICDSSDPFGPLICDAVPAQMQAEVCDGLDNNCDSETDENFPDVDSDGIADCVDPDYDGGVVVTYRRKKITIDPAYVDETLGSFPVLVSVSGDSELINDTQHDEDVYFTDSDGTTLLSFEVESYSRGSGDLTAWVKIPSISNSADTVFYLYYGDGADHWDSVNGNNPAGVWSNDFNAVWHLDDVASVIDSSGGGHTGTNTGAENVAGQIEGAASFYGADSIDLPADSVSGISTHITISLWQYGDAASQPKNDYIICAVNGSWTLTTRVLDIHLPYGDSHIMWDAGLGDANTEHPCCVQDVNRLEQDASTDSTFWEGDWNYWVFTKNTTDAGGTMRIYHNGSEWASTMGSASELIGGDNVTVFKLGAKSDLDPDYDYDGNIDEFRISATERSAAWIKAEFENQKSGSTFLAIETE